MNTCKHCGREWPATTEHFPREPRNRSSLSSKCRLCWRDYHRAWKKKNPEKVRAAKRKTEAKRQKLPHIMKRRRERYAQKKWTSLCKRARLLGIPININREWFMAQWNERANCPICGVAYEKVGAHSRSPDRLIPERGYVLGNVNIICQECNRIKTNLTLPSAQRLVRWLESLSTT